MLVSELIDDGESGICLSAGTCCYFCAFEDQLFAQALNGVAVADFADDVPLLMVCRVKVLLGILKRGLATV